MAVPSEQALPEVRYKIIRGRDMVDLANAVNANIEAGWVPSGGVCYVPPNLIDVGADIQPHPFWQAMMR